MKVSLAIKISSIFSYSIPIKHLYYKEYVIDEDLMDLGASIDLLSYSM